MRNIEMNYYNVYYYCNIIDNLLHLFTSSLDWVPSGAQFTEPFFGAEPECFPKYSALHAFCDFAVRKLMSEDAEEQLEKVQEQYDELQGEKKAKRLRLAFEQSGNGSCLLKVDRIFGVYEMKHETFFSYLMKNDFDSILDAYYDFVSFDGELDDVILHLTREFFYSLSESRFSASL